ncbi:MAG: radical SAM protein [Spirochaetes bacterium]|nr:radical SAM protein [Spirochaetota bacterium]
MKKKRIFKTPKIGKIIRYGAIYFGKWILRKPLIFNLNLNVTNLCNQNCPMCNAVIVGQGTGTTITFEQVQQYLEILKPHRIASLTISGGEPSLVKDMPKIFDYVADKFPFGVNCNSNLYAPSHLMQRFAEAALRNNIRIGTSFDGFGEIADRLRGAKDVAKRVEENIAMISEMKKAMKSTSTLNIHTVISDANIDQIPDILELSSKYGWTHTLAPVNNFFYQDCSDPRAPKLHYSEKLEKIIERAVRMPHIAVSKAFLLGIPKFAKGVQDKYCPYLTGIFKIFKIFLDPNGDVSLCSRTPLGNITRTPVDEIFSGEKYNRELASYRRCPGCWMACFVEILLATPRWYQKLIANVRV